MTDHVSGLKADTHPDNKIKVVIGDTQPLFRLGIISILSHEADIIVEGEAGSKDDLIDKVTRTIPDVVLLDINLPTGNIYALISKIKQLLPTVAVVVITPNIDGKELFEVIKAGASGYLNRNVDSDKFVEVIRKAGCGEYPITDMFASQPDIARKVLYQFQQLAQGKEIESFISPLTNREAEILNYMAHGNSNKQIAVHLDVSEQTIKNQVTCIFRKLDANARTEAVWKGLERGIISFKMYQGLPLSRKKPADSTGG